MESKITITKTEYDALLSKDNAGIESLVKTTSLIVSLIGILVLFWKISTYVNDIKNDVRALKDSASGYAKKLENITSFLIRKFEDFRHTDDDR